MTWPRNGWAGPTSFTLSVTHSVNVCLSTTFQNQNHMKTSKNLTGQLTLDELISSAEASHANHLAQQETGEGHPTIDIYGRKCSELFDKLAPRMSWRRTFVASLVGIKGWYSTRCVLTWKVKASKSFRSYFLLQASTPRTEGTEFGSWLPTPRAVEFVETPENFAKRNGDRTTNSMPNLSSMAQHVPQMLPTPIAWDGNGGGARKLKDGKAGALGYSLTLKDRAAAGMLPTPSATSDPKGGATRTDPKRQRDTLAYAMHDPNRGKTSHLSPLFVEEMMGFPQGWTASPFRSGGESP